MISFKNQFSSFFCFFIQIQNKFFRKKSMFFLSFFVSPRIREKHIRQRNFFISQKFINILSFSFKQNKIFSSVFQSFSFCYKKSFVFYFQSNKVFFWKFSYFSRKKISKSSSDFQNNFIFISKIILPISGFFKNKFFIC